MDLIRLSSNTATFILLQARLAQAVRRRRICIRYEMVAGTRFRRLSKGLCRAFTAAYGGSQIHTYGSIEAGPHPLETPILGSVGGNAVKEDRK